MAKAQSRPQRWTAAIADARAALDKVTSAKEDLDGALQTLVELQQEYSDWYDNLPENLQSGALGEKLQAVIDLTLDGVELDTSEIESTVDEAEGVELPRGFGRD